MMPARKANLFRLARFQERLRSGAVIAMALLTGLPAYGSAASPRIVTAASQHGTAGLDDSAAELPALKAKLRRDFTEARAAKASYDLPTLLSLVTDCRGLAFKVRKLQPARVCDEAMFGVAQRLGDARSMVDADYWWQQHGFSAADKTSNVYLAFQKANLGRLVDTVPAFSARVADSSSVLKYQHRIVFAGHVPTEPMTWHRPTVMATINGKPVAVVVDTGTVVPLVMDRTRAAALGATPLLGELIAPAMGKVSPMGTRGFTRALIASFKFGGLVMHNVAATVVPDGTFQVGVLVGLPVLARFGRVDLNDVRIATGLAVPHCTSGMSLRFVGEGQLGFSTIANDQPVVAFIDTGDVNALTLKAQSKPGSSSEVKNTSSSERRDVAKANHRIWIQIGTWSVTEVNVSDASRAMDANRALPAGIDVNIGAPLLALADVRIDFSKPSLCVSPKPAVKDGAVIVFRNQRERR